MATRPEQPTPQQIKGEAAEQLAADILQQQGFRLVQRNFSCKAGEIDLIMQDQQHLVFVEVRFRKNHLYGGAAASITPAKQLKIRRAAQFYMTRLNHQPPCRFDVMAMTLDSKGHIICENWIPNAF